MKLRVLTRIVLVAAVAARLLTGSVAYAQASYSTGFESPEFTAGDVNGQNGWGYNSNSPTKGVVEAAPAGSPAAFGSQALAVRTNNVAFFGVSNHLFSATVDPAGETGSTIGGAVVAAPANHFVASFFYRAPSAPVTSTRADGRFAELNPSSKGAGAGDLANRYAQVRVVNVNNGGNLRFELGWFTLGATDFCVQTVAENLNWGEWYRLDYDIRFFDGLNGTNRPNDVFKISIYDLDNNLKGTATGSTWEAAWKTGSFGGGSTARAVNGFDLWTQTGPNDALVGHLDNFSMSVDTLIDPPAALNSVKISEYRLRGPSGALDEFVELYNNTDAALVVNDPTPPATGTPGWALVSSDNASAAKFVVPVGTVIPARGHFLVANSGGYSLSTYPAGYACGLATTTTPDGTYATDIPDLAPGVGACAAPSTNGRGIALFRTANSSNFNAANRLDAVGSSCEPDALFREGAGHAVLSATASSAEHSWFRNQGLASNGLPQDTEANASDFLYADTEGTSAGAGQRLGAPGPENRSSPANRNDNQITGFLLDHSKSSSQAPNRVRVTTPDPDNNSNLGTMEIRRRIVNNTGVPLTRLRFRIVDMTTLPAPAGTADLRVRSSGALSVSGIGDPATCPGGVTPCTLTVQGTTLEESPAQAKGGGYNASLSAATITLAAPLAPGASINVRFLLGVQATGNFRFYLNIEALP
ncbi:MAG TPA: lamin tail domain-containing protein [Pyrinomonadaceae bacterium]|nr:lamin tail domain-containing protein [Pyrinomonadaceae bacterium]